MSGPGDAALVARLAAALARMPGRRRAIFLAVRHDEASYDELAARFGITPAEIECELARALVSLADAADAPRPGWRRLVPRGLRRRIPE